jgi:hypothetical protein
MQVIKDILFNSVTPTHSATCQHGGDANGPEPMVES